jgi:ankyrin repeat protein
MQTAIATEIAAALLDAGADVSPGIGLMTPLHYACGRGNESMMTLSIRQRGRRKRNKCIRTHSFTFLAAAKVLIHSAKRRPEHTRKTERAIQHYTILEGYPNVGMDVVELLVDSGADLYVLKQGVTPADMAARYRTEAEAYPVQKMEEDRVKRLAEGPQMAEDDC